MVVFSEISNAEFRLLCEELGFLTPQSLSDYLVQNQPINSRPNVRACQAYFSGSSTEKVQIQQHLVDHLLELRLRQKQFCDAQKEIFQDKNHQGTMVFMFKDQLSFWQYYPQLDGLPVAFLTAAWRRLRADRVIDQCRFDYYEFQQN